VGILLAIVLAIALAKVGILLAIKIPKVKSGIRVVIRTTQAFGFGIHQVGPIGIHQVDSTGIHQAGSMEILQSGSMEILQAGPIRIHQAGFVGKILTIMRVAKSSGIPYFQWIVGLVMDLVLKILEGSKVA
jgi:hypothetical protein